MRWYSVNHGRATGAQLLDLARRVAASVQAKFGVALEPEPRIIGASGRRERRVRALRCRLDPPGDPPDDREHGAVRLHGRMHPPGSHQLHAFEIAFFRNFFGFVATLPLLYRHGFGVLRTNKLPLYFFRCCIGIVSMLSGFWAIAHLPLAQAIAISYSTPIFVTIGAVIFLGEGRTRAPLDGGEHRLPRRDRADAPGHRRLPHGLAGAVLAAVMSATAAINIKFLSRTENGRRHRVWTTMLWVPLSLLPALVVWLMPVGWTWLWIVLSGFLGHHRAHVLDARAGERRRLVLTPISFFQVLVVGVLGWLLFDEAVDRWTVTGAAIIFISNAYIAHREARTARRAVTDRDNQPGNPAALAATPGHGLNAPPARQLVGYLRRDEARFRPPASARHWQFREEAAMLRIALIPAALCSLLACASSGSAGLHRAADEAGRVGQRRTVSRGARRLQETAGTTRDATVAPGGIRVRDRGAPGSAARKRRRDGRSRPQRATGL
jgi:drug/metabolite transporter (DMT)-like permease